MNYQMIEQLEHTFCSLKHAGYQVRTFLQTVRGYRNSFYSDLTDAEFEALIRAYRYIYHSGGLMFRDSYNVCFISDQIASDTLKLVKEHLFSAKTPEEVFPDLSEKVFPETEEKWQ